MNNLAGYGICPQDKTVKTALQEKKIFTEGYSLGVWARGNTKIGTKKRKIKVTLTKSEMYKSIQQWSKAFIYLFVCLAMVGVPD